MYPSVTGSQRDTTATVTGREKARKRMQRFVAVLPPAAIVVGRLSSIGAFAAPHLTGTNLERVAGAYNKLTTLERRVLILDRFLVELQC